MDNAKERCIWAVINGPFGGDKRETRDKDGRDTTAETYAFFERQFDSLTAAITKVKDYIKNDILPWAMAPVALEDSSVRYQDIAGQLAKAKFTAGPTNADWGNEVEWVGAGADAYRTGPGSVRETQRKAIEASIDMAQKISDVLGAASQKRLTFLIDAMKVLAEKTTKLVTEFVGASNIMALLRLIFSLQNLVEEIGSVLIDIVAEYAKLCAESLAAAKELTAAKMSGFEVGGEGWPKIRDIADSMPGKRGWDEP
ncbi:MAG: hypothetical protein Q4G45_06130 [Actinomycetia bacterium]|nr:hypothetical protein [Actinomycetes bacterium]